MIRRIAALLALLVCPVAARAAELTCVVAPPVVALVDAQGEARVETGRYADLFAVREDALYAAGEPGDYRLIDARGQAVSDARFAMIDDAGDALIFRRDGLYGAMDTDGTERVAPQWTQLVSNGAGGFIALDGSPLDDQPDELILLADGEEPRRTGIYTTDNLSFFSDGRMPYRAPGGRYGALDAAGNVAIAPVWLYIGAFRDGLAEAEGDFGRGVIDVNGDVRIEAKYARLERGEAMIAARAQDGTVEAFAPDGGGPLFAIPGDWEMAVVGRCLAVSNADESRLYGADGARLVTASAKATFAPGTLGQVIVADGDWGEKCQRLVNPDGSDASGLYQRILPLCPGRYAYLTMDGASYYSRELGRLQKSWDYGSVRYGLLDADGRERTPAAFDEIRAAGEDRLLMRDAASIILADADGAAIRIWPTDAGAASSG